MTKVDSVLDLGGNAVLDARLSEISIQEYQLFQRFLSECSGIVLGDNKQYLVKNRLTGILKELDLHSLTELVAALKSGTSAANQLKARVIDAMTTNETFWFRDDMHFRELKEKLFPELLEGRIGTIRVWSAACSSGQEPYSVSICAEQVLAGRTSGLSGNVQVIGTDISDRILAQARNAHYSDMALSRGLSPDIRIRYFRSVNDGYKLKSAVTSRVRFQQFNLLKPFSVLGRFDIIFCRNVLIYFSEDVKIDILARMVESLQPGGYLFLSSTEAMPAAVRQLQAVRGKYARYFQKLS